MLVETSAKDAFKKRGIMGLLRYGFQRMTNMAMLEDQVSTLRYFTYQFFQQQGFTIQKIPPAGGPLRELQECDTVFLAIFDAACRKHHLEYCLDVGTLLGAVRHRGFIPWDDDADVFMMRDEFERALPILQEELGQYGISVNEKALRIGVGYHNAETGIWIDVFAKDYVTLDKDCPEDVETYLDHYWKYRRGMTGKVYSMSREKERKLRRKCMPEICAKENAKSIIDSLEWPPGKGPVIFKTDDYFPLKPIQFENYTLMGPNNPHECLKCLFGEDYMGFPSGGVMHHSNETGNIANWAANHGINMKDIKHELEEILEKINRDCK